MAKHTINSPAGGLTALENASTVLQSFKADALYELKGRTIRGVCRTGDTGLYAIRWDLWEYSTEGTTGSTSTVLTDDPRVGTALPTGKHNFTQGGTNVPNGSGRWLWGVDMPPATPFELPLIDVLTGDPIVVRAGRVMALVLTLPATGTGVPASVVAQYGLTMRDL